MKADEAPDTDAFFKKTIQESICVWRFICLHLNIDSVLLIDKCHPPFRILVVQYNFLLIAKFKVLISVSDQVDRGLFSTSCTSTRPAFTIVFIVKRTISSIGSKREKRRARL